MVAVCEESRMNGEAGRPREAATRYYSYSKHDSKYSCTVGAGMLLAYRYFTDFLASGTAMSVATDFPQAIRPPQLTHLGVRNESRTVCLVSMLGF